MAREVITTQERMDELEIGTMVRAGDYIYYLAGSPEKLNLRGMLYYFKEGVASIFGGGAKVPQDLSRYTRPRKKIGWYLYGGPSTDVEGVDRLVQTLPLPVTMVFEGNA